jgi:hypothetical protein
LTPAGGSTSLVAAGLSVTAPAAHRCSKKERMTESLKATVAALFICAQPVPPEHDVLRHDLRRVFHPRETEEFGDGAAVCPARLFRD